eukprot:gnl/Spiro4/8002_TR4205_c0_g1_i1.p1 gnl/Spiro4/8002_TR4205_c0_g1~~gnl/Spiro4/8002_TR4205_c0_g1_i1.p1  ORF type:complete len:297 (-),score=50.19 gnl/Spiro4/8002_TR4205_c0_g1_i1:83-973(-)
MESLPSQLHCTLKGHLGSVLVVRFNGEGTYCLSGGADKTLRLWNPTRGSLIKTYTGHGYEVLDTVIFPDNSKFASCGGDRMIYLWDVATGQVIRKLRGHESRINTVALNNDASVLVSGAYDRSMRFYDLRARSLESMQAVSDFKDSVTCVAVKDYEVFATSVDGCLRIFDIRAGQVFVDHLNKPITSLTISHDCNCVLLSCLDSTLRLMDKTNGELLNEYRGHSNTNYKVESCLTFTDSHVVGGSEDGVVFFWDLVEARVVHTLKAHSTVTCGVVYHPSQHCLLTSCVDGSVNVWR